MPHARSGIEGDLQLVFFAASRIVIFGPPLFEFIDQLDSMETCFGNFFQALFENKIAVDGPQHHRNREWRIVS